MLKSSRLLCVLIAIASISATSMWAQTKSETKPEPAKKTAAKKPVRRLPNNYGKLGLLPKQREEIYAIQAKYKAELDKLVAQVVAIKAERDKQIHEVLTSEQKEALAKLENARKTKSAKKASETAKTPEKSE